MSVRLPRGGEILATVLLLDLALIAVAGTLEGASEEGFRIVIRYTARVGVVLLCAAFGAASLRTLRASAVSRWLLANRRALGLSFALTHTLHLVALVGLQARHPETGVMTPDPVTYLGGGGAYAFLFAMAATSSDAAVRRLGRERWRRLHTFGGWYLWGVFFQSYGGRTAAEPLSLATFFTALLLATAGLRIARFRRRRVQ